jgi:acyl carrier protein
MEVAAAAQDDAMDRLQAVFRDVFNDDALVLRPEMSAADIPGWDSLSNVLLIIAIETTFRIRLKPREINALSNVGDMMALVCRARQAGMRR